MPNVSGPQGKRVMVHDAVTITILLLLSSIPTDHDLTLITFNPTDTILLSGQMRRARILRQHSNVNKFSCRVWRLDSALEILPGHRDSSPSFNACHSTEQTRHQATPDNAGAVIMVATPESFEHLSQYRQSPKRDQVLCPFSPTSNISQASKHPVAVPCGEPHESDPNVHMVRTSNDMHAFLSLESEGWTRSQASSRNPAVRSKRGDESRGLVRAVAKGNETSLLADYGARIWRELARTTAEHLISYRCK
ncbi:hypothetical protein Z517_11636 [Fonsecaea pedrosoi CBS 271.37]|uniref:Uncharacterized protein n=1 Tax=Fonsecaea pedrosoi CBS 271.37 TaxID=1442368 RepID=A0A0D2DB83_9EURO|nr:uncharacterized protein Z517_11636 [Fonsecaea pedrosoi CBS 271.37]KIW74866.1 hypothetical protein Z517_11636 [Fonsecaea pedrosoi CBS 271.37]